MAKRQIEVYTAGCPICDPAVKLVRDLACPDCEVTVHDLREEGAGRARAHGIHRVPAVVVDGIVVPCCENPPVDASQLRAAGVGQRLA